MHEEKTVATGISRRKVIKLAVLGAAGSLAAPAIMRRAFAADTPTVVNSIRSLSNPYHATWNKGGAAFAKSVGAEYVTLVTEGNSEKGIADIKAILAKTGGNCVHQRRPQRQPGRPPDRRGLPRQPAPMSSPSGTSPTTCIPGTSTRTTSPTSPSAACPTARPWPKR